MNTEHFFTDPSGVEQRFKPALAPAALEDADAIAVMLQEESANQTVLARNPEEIKEIIQQGGFYVSKVSGQVVGCGCCELYDPTIAEVRSIAVHPDFQSFGIGGSIVRACVAHAKERQIPQVFLTTNSPEYFFRFGFETELHGKYVLWRQPQRVDAPTILYASDDNTSPMRHAREEDIQSIYTLLTQHRLQTESTYVERAIEEMRDHRDRFLVYDEDGVISGCICYLKYHRRIGEVLSFAIANGTDMEKIGEALMQACHSFIDTDSVQDVFMTSNDYLVPYLEQHGFSMKKEGKTILWLKQAK